MGIEREVNGCQNVPCVGYHMMCTTWNIGHNGTFLQSFDRPISGRLAVRLRMNIRDSPILETAIAVWRTHAIDLVDPPPPPDGVISQPPKDGVPSLVYLVVLHHFTPHEHFNGAVPLSQNTGFKESNNKWLYRRVHVLHGSQVTAHGEEECSSRWPLHTGRRLGLLVPRQRSWGLKSSWRPTRWNSGSHFPLFFFPSNLPSCVFYLSVNYLQI